MEQLQKKQCSMVNPKESETMKLGSLAVWWSPLIIVCPDPVYLSKLFLVWQKGPAQALSNKKARARGQSEAAGPGGEEREGTPHLPGLGPWVTGVQGSPGGRRP